MAVKLLLLTIFCFICSVSVAAPAPSTLQFSTLHETRFPTPPTLADKILGTALSLSGTYAAVSAHPEGNNNATGSVYLFDQQKRWQLQAEITTPALADNFAKRIILTDTRLIVSADRDDDQGTDSGAVYVFKRNAEKGGSTWRQEAKIVAPDTQAGDHFGAAIFLADNTLYIGAPEHDKGKVYIYQHDNKTNQWGLVKSIVPTDSTAVAFGFAIAQEDNTLIIGAPKTDDKRTTAPRSINWRFVTERGDNPDYDGFESGVIFVYTLLNDEWQPTDRLSPSNRWSFDHFGETIALNGNTIAGGVAHKFVLDDLQAGSVYIFKKSADQWREQSILDSNPTKPDGYFGISLSLSDQHLLVGAHRIFTNGTNSGEVSVFSQNGGDKWQPIHKRTSATVQAHDFFGRVVVIADDKMVIASKTAVYSFQNHAMERASAVFYPQTGWLQLDSVSVGDTVYKATFALSNQADSAILTLTASGVRKDLTSSDISFSPNTGHLVIPKLTLQHASGKDAYYRVTLRQINGAKTLQFAVDVIDPLN